MVDIQFQATSDRDILKEIRERLGRIGEALDDIGHDLMRAKDQVFEAEGQPRVEWEPLAESTVEDRGGRAHPILQRPWETADDHQHLKDSWKAEVDKQEKSVRLASESHYAMTHQYGSDALGHHIPARPLLLPEATKDHAVETIVKRIMPE